MTGTGPDVRDERVLILAPTGRDAELACKILQQAGMCCQACATIEELCRRIEEGGSAGIVAKEALSPPAARALVEILGDQAPWSDFPLIVLTGGVSIAPAGIRLLETIRPLGNVTLIERPVRIMTLVSSVRGALAARRRQYQVRDLLRQLGEAVTRRDEFLAMLGHELRNPLAAICNAIKLLGAAPLGDPEAVEAREIIDRQSRHLGRLVDDLLDVTRINSGKIVLDRRPVDLVELVRRGMRQLDDGGKSRRHDVRFSAHPEPLIVEGDGDRLEQVITNLLVNALKYTPPGGRIEVSVRPEKGQAELRVADSGVGLAPEMLSQIFEPFAQVDGTLDRAQGGFGIGLALVRNLVSLHGGSVEARSPGLGRGSEFVVRLPLAAGSTRPASQRGPSRRRIPDGPRRHILIVEDHPDNRRTMRVLLQSWGHRVEVAEDGTDGVERAIATHPEFALIDIGLPGLDGYEVARRIRSALGDAVFLIALTGYGQPGDRHRALEAGFDTHLVKPVDLDELERMLEGLGAGKIS
jgi:signal transduction histidine kinase